MADLSRDQLLAATMAHVSETGLADFSLRSVAAGIGTSHRMLSHYFGSRAGLEAAIVKTATELMTAPLIAAGSDVADLSAVEQLHQIWEALTEPAVEPMIRLYFDIANRAMHGDMIAVEAVETIRDHWAQTVSALGHHSGEPEEQLLGAAVTSTFLKGLLLDRLAGANLAQVDASFERFVELVESFQR